jgi:hypothetical protein
LPPDLATPANTGPALLRALDHVIETDDGYIADCPIWGCGELTELTVSAGMWTASCDAGHTTEDLVAYLQCDMRVDQADTRRLWRAVVLAPSLEVCEALLRGQDVPRSQLDPLWARRLGL